MKTRFPEGGLVVSQVGMTPRDLIFWKITERKDDKIRLTRLAPSYTVKGNLIPGEPDPHEKPIHRKVVELYGGELLAPVLIGGYAAGLKAWTPTLKGMGRGGKRIGAGRKKGSGKGASVQGKTVYLKPDEWAHIKEISGSAGVSDFIRKAIFFPENNFQKSVDG